MISAAHPNIGRNQVSLIEILENVEIMVLYKRMRPLSGPLKLCPPKVIIYWMRYVKDKSVRAVKTKNLIGTKHCSGRAYFKCH